MTTTMHRPSPWSDIAQQNLNDIADAVRNVSDANQQGKFLEFAGKRLGRLADKYAVRGQEDSLPDSLTAPIEAPTFSNTWARVAVRTFDDLVFAIESISDPGQQDTALKSARGRLGRLADQLSGN